MAAIVGAIGGIGYWHWTSEQDEMLVVAVDRGWNPFDIIDPANPQPGDVDHGEAPWEKYRLAEEYQKAEDRIVAFQVTAGLGGIAAALILLWNIIWHISHWVWMGRKE